MFMKRAFLILAILFCAQVAFGQDEYHKGTFVSKTKDTLLYRYLTPCSIKSGEKYPLVIFLHGSGERGNDNKAQLFHGSGQFLNPVNREKYPSYVLFPQCPAGVPGAYMPGLKTLIPADMPVDQSIAPIVVTLMELIDSYISLPSVDPDRVYIMGISMGGIATFDIVSRFPEKFAAAIPICGSVNPKRLETTKDVAWRIFHGDSDAAVTVEGSRQAYKALKALGYNVEYIEFPGCGHNSWNPAFNYPDFMEWLYKQKRN